MFARLVKSPVKSVDVEMHVAAAAGIPAHRAERIFDPRIAEITRVLRPVAQSAKRLTRLGARVSSTVRVAPRPAIDETARAQNDSVVGLRAAEPVVVQFG